MPQNRFALWQELTDQRQTTTAETMAETVAGTMAETMAGTMAETMAETMADTIPIAARWVTRPVTSAICKQEGDLAATCPQKAAHPEHEGKQSALLNEGEIQGSGSSTDYRVQHVPSQSTEPPHTSIEKPSAASCCGTPPLAAVLHTSCNTSDRTATANPLSDGQAVPQEPPADAAQCGEEDRASEAHAEPQRPSAAEPPRQGVLTAGVARTAAVAPDGALDASMRERDNGAPPDGTNTSASGKCQPPTSPSSSLATAPRHSPDRAATASVAMCAPSDARLSSPQPSPCAGMLSRMFGGMFD